MAKPLARVLALLEILQGGGTRTVRELSGRLGVDERTVRRYVGHLLDLDVPVESVRGRYGGYRLAPGYRMPPLMLTDEEALAVLLGLAGTRRAALRPHTAVAVESATAKVRRVLPRALASRLDALVAATSYADEGPSPVTPEAGVLLTVAEAAVRRRPLAITYRDKAGRSTERVLEPYGVVALRGRWYATGLDSRSGQTRSFRLDRVARAVLQEGHFSVPGGFDPAARVAEAVSGASYRHAVSVQVHGSEPAVRTRLPGSMATVEPIAGKSGWVRVRWRAERLDWVPSVLAGLGRPFIIEEPGELREGVRALAARLASWAGGRDDERGEEIRMRVLMIAPPGAGKGTQGALIAAHFGIPHIATGDLLRDHVARRTELGLGVQEHLDRGELVPDHIVLTMVREALAAAKAAGGGYVLDGIPRNMRQARAAYQIGRELGMTADVALHLDADDAEVTRRLLARAALEHRSDDTAEVIAQRLALYHQVTSPIVGWYRDRGILVSVDAMRPAHEVGREILTALEAMRPLVDRGSGQERDPGYLTTLGEAFGATGADAP